MPLDYTLAGFGLAGFISVISSVFIYMTKGKVEKQSSALKTQSDTLKQIEAMAEDLEMEMSRSEIKLTNIKEMLGKRFEVVEERRPKHVTMAESDLITNIDFEHLPEEIKKDPAKYIEVLQTLAKYDEFKKSKKDVMFG